MELKAFTEQEIRGLKTCAVQIMRMKASTRNRRFVIENLHRIDYGIEDGYRIGDQNIEDQPRLGGDCVIEDEHGVGDQGIADMDRIGEDGLLNSTKQDVMGLKTCTEQIRGLRRVHNRKRLKD